MPQGQFYDLNSLPSWQQYAIASKSLVAALGADNPEETLFLSLTISELSTISLALSVMCRLFPEFVKPAGELSLKITDVNEAQQFLQPGSLDDE